MMLAAKNPRLSKALQQLATEASKVIKAMDNPYKRSFFGTGQNKLEAAQEKVVKFPNGVSSTPALVASFFIGARTHRLPLLPQLRTYASGVRLSVAKGDRASRL